jgi:hypothetical protein
MSVSNRNCEADEGKNVRVRRVVANERNFVRGNSRCGDQFLERSDLLFASLIE